MKKFSAAVLSAVLTMASAWAGQVTTVRFEEREPGSDESRTGTIQFRGDRMRIESASGEDDGPGLIIFRGDRQLLWIIDVEDESYFQMDRESVENMSDRVSAAMKRYQEQLDQLPPAQRELAEKMMKGRLPEPAPKAAVEIRDAGREETIDGYPCRLYEIYRGDEKDSEVWATDLSSVPGAEDFARLLKAVGEFWQPLVQSFPGGEEPGEIDFAALGGLHGFPILVKNFDSAGRVSNEVHMTEIASVEAPDSAFELDPSYRRRDPLKGIR